MRLLRVNEDLTLDIIPEVLEIPEFKAIVKRVKKCKGDTDGRLKLMARKELAYVYHMSSDEGPYFSFPPKERHQRLANDLFEDHKWEPDAEILAGIEKFKELNQTPSSKTVGTIINALHKANKIVDTLINEIENNLDEEKYKQGVTNKQGQIVTGVEIMLGDIQALIKAANEIPKSIDIFEKLQEKILKEKQVAASKFRGGAEISDFERS
jgi:uncharacterized protein YqgV (UPF0045/DUF77 family)